MEGCILKIINDDEVYGYEIAEKLKEFGLDEVSEGTIYPLLLRLEKIDWLTKLRVLNKIENFKLYYRIVV